MSNGMKNNNKQKQKQKSEYNRAKCFKEFNQKKYKVSNRKNSNDK